MDNIRRKLREKEEQELKYDGILNKFSFFWSNFLNFFLIF